jgi:cbb3-type cytochrome oxidase maturation protein
MSVILLLILGSLVLASGFLVAFVWAVKCGQFEDTCTPSMRILSDECPRSTLCDSTKPHVSHHE